MRRTPSFTGRNAPNGVQRSSSLRKVSAIILLNIIYILSVSWHYIHGALICTIAPVNYKYNLSSESALNCFSSFFWKSSVSATLLDSNLLTHELTNN